MWRLKIVQRDGCDDTNKCAVIINNCGKQSFDLFCVFLKKNNNLKEEVKMCENMEGREGGEEKGEGGRFQKREKQKPSHDGMDTQATARA